MSSRSNLDRGNLTVINDELNLIIIIIIIIIRNLIIIIYYLFCPG